MVVGSGWMEEGRGGEGMVFVGGLEVGVWEDDGRGVGGWDGGGIRGWAWCSAVGENFLVSW